MGNNISNLTRSIFFKDFNSFKLGRWSVDKNGKQIDINSYWSNIDNCGDKVCGNLQDTKSFYEKEILKINTKIKK